MKKDSQYQWLIITICLSTNQVFAEDLTFRNIFIYHEIGREPYSKECRDGSLTGQQKLVAIHVTDISELTEPCHCLLYNTDPESHVEVIRIKHQSLSSPGESWKQVEEIKDEEWSALGYKGLYITIEEQGVVFVLQERNITTKVAVAIEVGMYNIYFVINYSLVFEDLFSVSRISECNNNHWLSN